MRSFWVTLACAVALGCGGKAAVSNESNAGGASAGASAGGSGASAGTSGVSATDWAACEPADACILETQTTCGPGCEPVPLDRFIPINRKNEAAYRAQQLNPPCIDIGCSEPPPGSANIPNYYAACEAGRCTAFDVRTSALSACTSDAQCELRSGMACCQCGFGDLVAVSTAVDLKAVLCGGMANCPLCTEPALPPGGTHCVAGHCAVLN